MRLRRRHPGRRSGSRNVGLGHPLGAAGLPLRRLGGTLGVGHKPREEGFAGHHGPLECVQQAEHRCHSAGRRRLCRSGAVRWLPGDVGLRGDRQSRADREHERRDTRERLALKKAAARRRCPPSTITGAWTTPVIENAHVSSTARLDTSSFRRMAAERFTSSATWALDPTRWACRPARRNREALSRMSKLSRGRPLSAKYSS